MQAFHNLDYYMYMLQVIKRLHLLSNFSECLTDCDHDLMMDELLKTDDD